MLNLNSINSREDFKWDIIRKAGKDAAFRDQLRKDPSGTASSMAGGAAVKVNLHQESADNVYFLINYNPNLPAAAASITINPSDNPEEVVVKKAWKDPAYRAQLLANPDNVIRAEFGSAMPSGTKLVVLEETADTLELILPNGIDGATPQTSTSGELSDADLESVAGGGLWSWIATKLGYTSSTSSCNPSTNSGSCGCSSASGVRA